jgi:hypothetical protein
MNELIQKLDRDIINGCMQNKCSCKNHVITPAEVREAVKLLNKGKHRVSSYFSRII